MKGCEWYVINNDELRKQLNTALRAIDSLTKERDEARGWLEKISQPRLRRGLGDIRILKEIGYDYSAQVLEAVDAYLSQKPDGGTSKRRILEFELPEELEGKEIISATLQLPKNIGRYELPKSTPCPECGETHKPKDVPEDGTYYLHDGRLEDCPTCNPPKCEHKNLGMRIENGARQWCHDCCGWIPQSEIKQPTPYPARNGALIRPDNIDKAVERACEEKTLLDALTFICAWESERVVKQARENETWETCFRVCLKSVLDSYTETCNPKDDFHGNNLLGVKLAEALHNPKPAPCPECGGTRQKKIVVESNFIGLKEYERYTVYEACPRCEGLGFHCLDFKEGK